MQFLACFLLAEAVATGVEDALDKDDCDAALNAMQFRGTKVAQSELNREAKLRSSLQSKLDEFAQRYNTSFQLGYRDHELSIELAAGVENHVTGEELSTSSIIPLGSATKTWTAVAVLHLVERGTVKLDDPLQQHVDPILRRLHNTTLLALWKDPRIEQITVKQVLGMRSGLNDYDDAKVFDSTFEHPDADYPPIKYLEQADKAFVCDPDSCAYYTGIGYILLGYLLAEKLSVDGTWQGYDQMFAIPKELRRDFPRTRFPKTGKCNKIPGVVHQYRDNWRPIGPKDNFMFDLDWTDIRELSCLNGWTMGNIVAPAIEQANFLYYLLVAQKIISPGNFKHMTDTKFITKGWGSNHLKYGLGLEADTLATIHDGERFPLLQHGGLDWGSRLVVNMADPKLGFSLVVSTNSYTGMNCSLPNVVENLIAGDKWGLCNFLDPVLAVYADEGKSSVRLNCTAYYNPESRGRKGKCVHGWQLNPMAKLG